MNDHEAQADTGRLIADKVELIEDLKMRGEVLMRAAVAKLNKPMRGTVVFNAAGRGRSVDKVLIEAVRAFGELIDIKLGEESETEALDRRAHQATRQKIEVVPHDPEGPKSREDIRGCKPSSENPSVSGTSD